jgi:hypothetical protein
MIRGYTTQHQSPLPKCKSIFLASQRDAVENNKSGRQQEKNKQTELITSLMWRAGKADRAKAKQMSAESKK